MQRIRLKKGRDGRQEQTWQGNKHVLLSFFRENHWGLFNTQQLLEKMPFREPTLKKHLTQLETAKIIMKTEGRPAEWRLRPLWPMPRALVDSLAQTLQYASAESPPNWISIPLDSKTRAVTIRDDGKVIKRDYKIKAWQPLGIADLKDDN